MKINISIGIRTILMFFLVIMLSLPASANLKDVEREYYDLDYKIREWDRIRKQSGKVVIPENFENDLARWNQLSGQLGFAKAKEAADIGAEDNTKNVLVELIKHDKTTEYALSAIDKALDSLKKEEEFYKDWEREADKDTGIAVTLYGQDRERFQKLKDEAVRRQRELRQQIDSLQSKHNSLTNFKSTFKGLLAAGEIKGSIEEGDFFAAADKAIDAGSELAETYYDKKTFEDVSGRLEVGKGFLDVGNKIYQGNYLDASISAADTVDKLLADYEKDYEKESKTLQLFMETDFVDQGLKNKALKIIDIANERKSKIESLVNFKNKVKFAGDKIKKFKKYYGYYKTITNEIGEYQRLASMPGRSENTARLIYGMSKLGDTFNMVADALPPGLKETLGQFLEFYGDALKLGESIDKIIRDYFEKRGDCLNIVGSELSRSYALKMIEAKWGRDDLCIRPAPEFKQAQLAMFYDDNLGKTYKEPKYFFIPRIEAEPSGITSVEYSSIVKIASDYSAYASFVESSYRLTNEDLQDIITAVQTGRDSFTINDGYFRDTTFKINQLKRDVEALFHIKASIGDELTTSNHRNMIDYWYIFVDSTEFTERLCRFRLYDNENIRHRMFVTYLKNRDSFEEFVLRQRLTNSSSQCKIDVSISGDRETVVNKPATAIASIKNARDTFRYEWLNESDGTSLSSAESVSLIPAQEGTYRLRFNLYVKSSKSDLRIASISHVIVAKPDLTKECTYQYSQWGECSSATKNQIRNVLSKAPTGCVEKTPPVLEQSCTPIVKAAPACAYQYSEWSACDEISKKQTRRVISRAPVNCIEKDKPILEQSCTSVTKSPPTCSFKYSEWGECSRATKKQTRSVISKEPAGCAENQKPGLEQGCTPPPSEEDKRNTYLNCLCRCSSGWAGHIGVWYDPEGKSKPECESSGPCFGGAGAWGCTRRHFFNAPSDCAKGCWESAFGKGTYDRNKADKMGKDENKKYAKPITVKLKASKNPADFAEIVNLTAEASEGTGGYSYNWGGCAQDAKDAGAKVLNTRTCQSCTASVTVTDQDGNSASGSITIQCNALNVKLKKELPKDNSVPVGGKASFYAEVFSGDKPASGSFTYIWERNPDAIFGDPKNPKYETQGGSQMRNTALFRKAGTTPVWVSVLKEVEGRKVTVGESEQIPIEVGNPELTITYTPKEPFIGQEVKLQVTTRPKMGDDIIGFWWEIPNYWTGTGDKASFKSKDSKPVKVTVHAKTKDGGDEVGTKDVVITAKGYQVSVSEPRYLESPPQMWQCDTQLGQAQRCGMVTLKPNQFVTHRDIFFKATVTPNPDSPRYRWTVDPSGSCGFPGSGSEIKINCSNTGTYTVKLEVTNADGAKLGEASTSVTISISQAQIDNSKKAKDAYDKLQKAKELVAQGKLDEGITLASESAGLDPKNTEAKSLLDKWKNDLQGIKKHIVILEQLLKDNKLTEAEKELQSAQRINAKHQLVLEAENRLKAKKQEFNQKQAEAQRLKAEGEAFERQGKLQDAVNKYKESIKIIPDKALDDNIKRLEAEIAKDAQKKQTADKLWDECSSLAKQNKLSEAFMKCKESLSHWSSDKRAVAVKEMEIQINQTNANKVKADRLWDECALLTKQSKNQEALNKCRESLSYWSSDKRVAAVKDLENIINQESQKKATADRLWDECSALAKQNRPNEALAKCRESLKYWSSDKRLAAVRDMEQLTNQTNQKQEQCKLLMNEGYQLKQQGRLKDALAKYEEAQKICPNAETEQIITSIKKAITSVAISDPQSQFYHLDLTPYGGKKGTSRKVKNIEVDDGSWIRLKATHEKKLNLDISLPAPVSANSIAIISNLDNAHHVKDDVTTTVLTVYTKSGNHTFEIKAGVHSSEWNRGETGGADHRFPKENHLGDKRWLAVFQLPQGSIVTGMKFDHRDTDKKYYHAGAAPGFCLRGITLIKSGGVGVSTDIGNVISTETKKGKVIFDNGNTGGVSNTPTRLTTFTINQPHVITLIQNYHWNNARGSTPGTIALRDQSGRTYGPWQSKGLPGQGGVPNAYWNVHPNITIPAGTYTIIDSNPSTWAQNSGSQGAGFAKVEGYPVSAVGNQQIGGQVSGGTFNQPEKILTAELKNSSNQNVHIFVEEQDTFGQHNRISPNEIKKVNIKRPSQGGFIKFIAGRNGQILATCRWEYDPDTISGRVPVVTFNEPNMLSCVTGLR